MLETPPVQLIVVLGKKDDMKFIEIDNKIRYMGGYFYEGRLILDIKAEKREYGDKALIPVDAENINKKLFTIIRGREEEFAETFIEQESERERFLTKEVDGRLIALPEFPEEMLFPGLLDLE